MSRRDDLGQLTEAGAQMGAPLSEPQAQLLLDYLELLTKWNRVYNLTAVRAPAEMLVLHLLDSMSIVAPLRRWGAGNAKRLLDVGSGAGLPGAVIAALMPEMDVTCVDAVGKKVSFIRQVAGELGIKNLHAEHARVEELSAPRFDVLTARAFSSLLDLTTLTRRHVHASAVWAAMKAKRPKQAIAALPAEIDVFHVEQLTVPGLDAERCLVWMKVRV
ncbi:MAG: 16S rRNA (guanine(527)-N(7))-methyltransferase RsmG [Burkholderiaceae bacterium]|nr:16S rRNA (guanine(527)-N(7))-methyltransferase RsmG [Burkholderiaceae bacterium]MDH3459768.1 16S rRNA (guanine(527)-N(7))-methyltransferase RsmG [Burkholderiaceae bacterium]